MRAISLWEPWASAIATGLKTIETRGWATNFRGPLAIHAARTTLHADFIHVPEVRPLFASVGIVTPVDLAFGCVVATCTIVDCRASESLAPTITETERLFGSYEPGRFGWMLANVVRLPKPIPARGAQGFWQWNGGQELGNSKPEELRLL